jgi:hypothetical protein
MLLRDASAGSESTGIPDPPAEPDGATEPDVLEFRRTMRTERHQAAERIAKHAQSRRPVSFGDLADVVRFLQAETLDLVTHIIGKRCVLRTDVGEVKSIAPLWRGTWQPDVSYATNSLVNDKGGLWISKKPTAARPGEPDSAWQLVVKSPR